MDTLKDRVMDRLSAINQTQFWLANELNVSPQSLNGWLKRNRIPVNHIFKVAEKLECSVSWLTGEKSHELQLNEREKLLLIKFRALSKDEQERELTYLRGLIAEQENIQ